MSHYSQTVRASRDLCSRAVHMAEAKAAGSNVGSLMSGQSGGGMGGLLGGGNQRKMAAAYQEYRGHVYTCITGIGRRLGGLPYGAGEIVNDEQQDKGAYATTKEGKRLARKRFLSGGVSADPAVPRRYFPASIKNVAGGAAIDAYLTHEALDLLNKPNPVQGKAEFLEQLVCNLYLSGEAYWIAGDGEEGPELWMPPTNWIVPKHDGGMFTSFELKPPGAASGVPLEPEMVRRMYFPDPADPKLAMSPVLAQFSPIRTDNAIQKSQEQMFDRGIFPNVVLTVGDTKNAEGKPAGKPTLTGPQRRQLIRAVREVWSATVSNGDPAIIDGLISSIHKLNNTPAEMDWLQSGETTKKRIFQAFGVNPIIVGEVTGANRAQAAVAEQHFLSSIINPLADRVTVVLNEFIAPMFGAGGEKEKAKEDDKKKSGKTKLYLWLEEGQPLDDELKLRKFSTGRINNDCTRNEFRTEILGLPPMKEEEDVKRVPLLDTVGGAQAIVNVLSAVGTGTVGPQSAVEAFKLLFEMDDAAAQALVADTGELGQQALAAPPAGKPPGRDTPPRDDDEDEGDPKEPPPDLPDVDEDAGTGGKAAGMAKIKRSAVKAHSQQQQKRLERQVAARLDPFSRASSAQLLRNLRKIPTGS
jgi:phage portal protein BeeE